VSLAISRDGKLLASVSDDNTIKLWGLPEGILLNTLTGHWASVESVALSPDGKLLVSGDFNGAIKLWGLQQAMSLGETAATCLIDLAASPPSTQGITYKVTTATGQTVEYTVPRGFPVPAGAACVCNTVAGTGVSSGGGGGGHYWYPN
jgi:WD40 repeat protein